MNLEELETEALKLSPDLRARLAEKLLHSLEALSDAEEVEAFAKAAVQIEVKTPTGPQLDMVTLLPMLNPRLLPVATMLIHKEPSPKHRLMLSQELSGSTTFCYS